MGNGNVVTHRTQPDSSESTAPSSVLSSSADEIAQAMLGLLAELEASLRGSHTAVLAHDGVGLENCTREQVRLHRALEMLLWPRAWPGTAAGKDALSGTRRSIPRSIAECTSFLAAELLAAERRVLQRTQAEISGVALDEKAGTMVQYQQAYDASAQVIATIHDMMYAVLNRSRLTV